MSKNRPLSPSALRIPCAGCISAGFLALFILLAAPTGYFLAVSYYKDKEEGVGKKAAISRMFQLATFVQQQRKQGLYISWGNYPNLMSQSPGFRVRREEYGHIRCYEIPESERKERLKGMEFYVYDEATETGVLLNGMVFEGKQGPDLLARLQSGPLK